MSDTRHDDGFTPLMVAAEMGVREIAGDGPVRRGVTQGPPSDYEWLKERYRDLCVLREVEERAMQELWEAGVSGGTLAEMVSEAARRLRGGS